MSTKKKEEEEARPISSLSLQDVLAATPAEDEAETRMIRSIEQDEEKGTPVSPGILPGVSEESGQVFTRASFSSECPKVSRAPKPSSKATAPETIEESLFRLNNLRKEQSEQQLRQELQRQSGTRDLDEARESIVSTQHDDLFTSNVFKLMERARLSRNKKVKELREETSSTYADFKSFMAFRKNSLYHYTKFVLCFLVGPFVGIACILFYGAGNPGGSEGDASISWWLLFVVVRQILTLSLAKGMEAFVIDFLCVRTNNSLRLLGPFFTLMVVQSKGWPFQLLAWGVLDFMMLYGNTKFARHWLFYQSWVGVFNASNPAGRVTEASSYKTVLILFIFVGGIAAFKRVFVGILYGQGVYRRYGRDLAVLMKKAYLIGAVAELSKDGNAMSRAHEFNLDYETLSQKLNDYDEEDYDDPSHVLIDTRKKERYSGGLSTTQKMKIHELLGEWEEPVTDERKQEKASISAIVQFRTASSSLDTDLTFNVAFGMADTREQCIASSQKLFQRLCKSNKDEAKVLMFDTVAVIALDEDGSLDETKLVELIGLFRPTRDGELTMLDFVKSIDSVYKDLRVIRASIQNANKMNAASQRIVEVIFYFILVCIVLAALGIDPIALFGGLAAWLVGISFMIGGASSKYFEGLLLVLNRKPYDIGDRIAVSGIENDVSGDGSSGWIVKDLDLFKTTVIFGTTGEEATYSNGSLADSRIINHNRSPKAVLNFLVRFGIDAPKEKVKAFAEAVEQYVKERPREWLAFTAFRLSAVQPDQGFVEYKVIMQHRESWQQIGALLTSKADVQLYAHDLSLTMGLRYESPPLPIIFGARSGEHNEEGRGVEDAIQQAQEWIR